MQANYTYSHALDEVSNGGFNSFSGANLSPEDPYNLRQNYGPADYDVRHNFNVNYVWQVPIRKALGGHGWAPLVDGWQVSGTVFYRTGLPYSITDSSISNTLAGNNYFGTIRPNPEEAVSVGCNPRASAFTNGTPVPCYSASSAVAGTQCTVAVQGQFGIPGCETGFGVPGLRNAFRGPQYVNTPTSRFSRTPPSRTGSAASLESDSSSSTSSTIRTSHSRLRIHPARSLGRRPVSFRHRPVFLARSLVATLRRG